MERIIRRISNVATTITLVVAVLILVVLLVPRLFRYNIYAVLSGSMEPNYHVGSVVYIKSADPSTIVVGDTIAYYLNEETIVTHRVVSVDTENEAFITKGDANQKEDAVPVSFSKVVGVGKFTIPFLGYLSVGMQTKKGIYLCAAILIILILLQIFAELARPTKEVSIKS